MNNHRTIRLLISMLTLIGLMGCAMPTKVRMHPDLVNEPGKIKTITLLPIDAQVKKLELSSTGERDQEKELEIIEQSSLVIPNILSSQGYQVTPYMIPYDAVESELFHQNYDELRAAYFSEMPRLYDGQKVSWKKVADRAVQINPIHLSFLSDDASDALLYVRYEGFKRSGGSTAAGAVGGVALGLLTGVVVVPVPEGGGFQAALIEKGTGKILWNNIANEGSYSMENRLESLLDKFPLQGEDLSLSIGRGKAVENSFRVEDHGFDNKPLPVPGEDRVLLDDGQEYLGEVIDVSKQNYMIKQGRILYIIAKDRVVQCSIAGEALSFEEARAIDFPRVNYNSFDDRITIY